MADVRKIDLQSLSLAKELLENDKLVAFPTETVYGLGANAYSDEAIKEVYRAKGRPLDNPLIVHVHKDYDVSELVYDNDIARVLRKAFLPGPLTLVYKSRGKVSGLVSCGLDTLAVRVPSSESAQKFLSFVDIPVAAPSANVSKHTSPVTAEHVAEDFGDNIGLILDGGRCSGGIESTVLDVTGEIPVILRKGLITAEDVIGAVGACEYAGDDSELNRRSPGTKYRHYTPKTETAFFDLDKLNDAVKYYENVKSEGRTPYIMCDGVTAEKLGDRNVLNLGNSGKEMASRLYYCLHEGEKVADVIIGVALTPFDDLVSSVNNRYLKAFAK